jgi:large subunit ribosomal protein L18
MKNSKASRRFKIRLRIRKRIEGTAMKPRLCIYKSNVATYAQIIDDEKGHTLVANSSKKIISKEEMISPVEKARKLGEEIAKQAIEQGVKEVVFDRSGYIYHGRVKALAEGARTIGLKF